MSGRDEEPLAKCVGCEEPLVYISDAPNYNCYILYNERKRKIYILSTGINPVLPLNTTKDIKRVFNAHLHITSFNWVCCNCKETFSHSSLNLDKLNERIQLVTNVNIYFVIIDGYIRGRLGAIRLCEEHGLI